MDFFEITGLMAAGLTTASFVPQVWQTWRTQSAADISVMWIILFASGVALWTIYGIAVMSLPIIAGNVVTLGLIGIIALVKFAPRSSAKEIA
jgi:MtN3 and saliva related transmembrane protein